MNSNREPEVASNLHGSLMRLGAVTPLPADIVRRIENLHRPAVKPGIDRAYPQPLTTLADSAT